jgi:hypothetical protein
MIRAFLFLILTDILATEAGISHADAQLFLSLWSQSHASLFA